MPNPAQAGPTPEDGERRLSSLERRLEQMQLQLTAVQELLQEKLNVSDRELTAKLREIDLRDGSHDGVMGPPTERHCNSCGRSVGSRNSRCLYCGSLDLSSPVQRP